MYAMVLGKSKPMIYKDFHEAKEKAVVGDRIVLVNGETTEEYIVPDYAKMAELEERIKSLGKFTTARKSLMLEQSRLMAATLKFEERSKQNAN